MRTFCVRLLELLLCTDLKIVTLSETLTSSLHPHALTILDLLGLRSCDTYRDIKGDVYYNSLTPREITAHSRGDVQDSPEDEIHFPTRKQSGLPLRLVHHTSEWMAKQGSRRTRGQPDLRLWSLSRARDPRWRRSHSWCLWRREEASVDCEALACRGIVNCWDKYVPLPV